MSDKNGLLVGKIKGYQDVQVGKKAIYTLFSGTDHQEELKKMIVEAISLLTDKERSVVTLYYYEEMTLKEISLVLDVSESRVSQLHTKALLKMKSKLGPYLNILI